MLEFEMVHCLVVLDQVCSNKGSRVQDRLGQGVLGTNHRNMLVHVHRKVFKNLRLQNRLAQMLEILYGVLPSSPLPSLFKRRSQGPRWLHARMSKINP